MPETEKMVRQAMQPVKPSDPLGPNEEFVLSADGTHYEKKIKAAVMAGRALNLVTLASEFREELFPELDSPINVGDRVYIRAARKFGNVVRVTAGTYRVEVDGMTNTFWPIEVEKR